MIETERLLLRKPRLGDAKALQAAYGDPEVMEYVVQVESHGNPYAIGVVGGRLLRQPRNLDEAMATAHMLDAGNHDYSLGLAQVHRANLRSFRCCVGSPRVGAPPRWLWRPWHD